MNAHKLFLLTLAYAILFPLQTSASGARFLSYPTLSPDGKTIVFSHDNDLWKVGANGGTAYRLTSMDGNASLPVFSPDGSTIAFSGSNDGNTNVFIMPAAGGETPSSPFTRQRTG